MSLDFDFSNIPDFKKVCYKDGAIDPMAKSIVWASMAVDMHDLTAKNVDEWIYRLSILYLKKTSPFAIMYKGRHIQHLPSMTELQPFYGLSTNVTNVSRTKWLTRQLMYVTSDTRMLYERTKSHIDKEGE